VSRIPPLFVSVESFFVLLHALFVSVKPLFVLVKAVKIFFSSFSEETAMEEMQKDCLARGG
jgi:hypothetical protein